MHRRHTETVKVFIEAGAQREDLRRCHEVTENDETRELAEQALRTLKDET